MKPSGKETEMWKHHRMEFTVSDMLLDVTATWKRPSYGHVAGHRGVYKQLIAKKSSQSSSWIHSLPVPFRNLRT